MKRAWASALLVVMAFGCGPDPFLGTYRYTVTAGEDHTTTPGDSRTAAMGTGTLTITHGMTSDYLMTMTPMEGGSCVLNGVRDRDMTISFPAGQRCTFRSGGAEITATLISGNARFSGSNLMVVLNYTYSGTWLGVPFAGEGTRTHMAVRM